MTETDDILTNADRAYISITKEITDILVQLPSGKDFDLIKMKLLLINELLEKDLVPDGFFDRIHKWEETLKGETYEQN